MDANRFDSWIRARAAGRRSLLGGSVAAGLGAVLSRIQPAAAQFGAGGTCSYAVSLTSSLSNNVTAGTLVLDIGTDGAIDTGSLSLNGQAAASIVGQISGSGIELLASLADGTTLSLSGVADTSSSGCAAAILGVLANTSAEQIGTWLAELDESPSGGAAPVPTATPTPSGVSSGTTSQPPPAPTPTPTPLEPTGACELPKMVCGQNCCPAGADCLDNGSCQCPTGTEECGIACFPSCADGVTPLEPVTCLCPTG